MNDIDLPSSKFTSSIPVTLTLLIDSSCEISLVSLPPSKDSVVEFDRCFADLPEVFVSSAVTLPIVAAEDGRSVKDREASGLFARGRGVISGASSKVSYRANMLVASRAA